MGLSAATVRNLVIQILLLYVKRSKKIFLSSAQWFHQNTDKTFSGHLQQSFICQTKAHVTIHYDNLPDVPLTWKPRLMFHQRRKSPQRIFSDKATDGT